MCIYIYIYIYPPPCRRAPGRVLIQPYCLHFPTGKQYLLVNSI